MEDVEEDVPQVVDKAVSTEDLGIVTRNIHLEVARLEAMLNTLVENKVESMKADNVRNGKDVPAKPQDKHAQRITSTSTTASSSQQHSTNRKKRRLHSGSPSKVRHPHRHGNGSNNQQQNEDCTPVVMPIGGLPDQPLRQIRPCCGHNMVAAVAVVTPGAGHENGNGDKQFLDETVDIITYSDHQHRPYNPCAYPCSCSCVDNQDGQVLAMPYDEDYVSINMELDVDLVDVVDDDVIISHEALRRARRKRRKRRRRKRRRQRLAAASAAAAAAASTRRDAHKTLDDDDLPQRARWTIIVTACVLLMMCLLLVGVTLRMAPIIDDMVRKENEQLLNSLSRDVNSWNATTTPGPVAAVGV